LGVLEFQWQYAKAIAEVAGDFETASQMATQTQYRIIILLNNNNNVLYFNHRQILQIIVRTDHDAAIVQHK